jgi:hypothetical protein
VHEFAVELQRASADAIRVNAQFLAETDSRKPVGRSAERCIQEVAFVEGLAPRLPIAGMGLQADPRTSLGYAHAKLPSEPNRSRPASTPAI